MNKRDIPVYAVLNFLNIIVAALAAKLFANIVIKFLVLFVEVDFFVGSMVQMVVLFLVFFGLLAFLAYKGGYREGIFDATQTLVSAALAALLHFLIGCLLSFTPWLFGAVRDLSGFLSLGVNYNQASRVEEIPFGVLIAIGFLMAVLAVLTICLTERIGVRARLRDREELTGAKNN